MHLEISGFYENSLKKKVKLSDEHYKAILTVYAHEYNNVINYKVYKRLSEYDSYEFWKVESVTGSGTKTLKHETLKVSADDRFPDMSIEFCTADFKNLQVNLDELLKDETTIAFSLEKRGEITSRGNKKTADEILNFFDYYSVTSAQSKVEEGSESDFYNIEYENKNSIIFLESVISTNQNRVGTYEIKMKFNDKRYCNILPINLRHCRNSINNDVSIHR